MKLLELGCNFNGLVSFLFKDLEENDKWKYPMFSGEPFKESCPTPIGIRDIIDGPPYPDTLPDFTNIAAIPTFSEHAIHRLGPMLSDHGEFAPIQMDEPVKYFGFNPTTVVDILDESRSEIVRFSSGRVMAVDRHVLLACVKQLPPIFKIPQSRRNTTYVNEAFVARVKATGLTGFKFNLLWDDESDRD